jgi:hypothetical protein
MDVPDCISYLQLVDTVFSAIGIATFLFVAGSAYPEVNGVRREVPPKPSRLGEHRARQAAGRSRAPLEQHSSDLSPSARHVQMRGPRAGVVQHFAHRSGCHASEQGG